MISQETGVGVRPARPDDVETMLAIARRCLGRGEFPGVTDHDIEGQLARIVALPETALVAVDDGRLAGWIIPRQFDLTVDLSLRRRGHGSRLVAAGRRLAAEDGLPNLRLWAPPPSVPGPTAFLRRVGFHYDASVWRMRLPAETPSIDPTPDPGMVVRPFRPGEDDEAFVELANVAFAEHPSPVRFTLEGIRFTHTQPGFDPTTISLMAAADDPERLVGFARVTMFHAEDGALVGDVHAIGLRPAWRGRGLGRLLLRLAVTDLRRRRAGDIHLSVEADNTAALRLYEAEGFAAEVEWPHWVLPL